MNTSSDAMSQSPLESSVEAAARQSAIRPLYWSVRRELWEYRSIYFVPLICAALVLLGYLIRMIRSPNSAAEYMSLILFFSLAAAPIMLSSQIVAISYCIGALSNERRERSILFWKSLPVSDLTTVLSKASIPLLILPLVTWAIVVATQLIMLIMGTVALLLSGSDVGAMWKQLPVFQMPVVQFYGLIVMMLWYAPIYGWLLMVSCWSRRVPLLWALSPLAVCIIERIAFDTTHFGSLLLYRLNGVYKLAFDIYNLGPGGRMMGLADLTPGKYFRSPDLWIGLTVAAVLIAAAVQLRRYRAPG